jgi:hypothetical protein
VTQSTRARPTPSEYRVCYPRLLHSPHVRSVRPACRRPRQADEHQETFLHPTRISSRLTPGFCGCPATNRAICAQSDATCPCDIERRSPVVHQVRLRLGFPRPESPFSWYPPSQRFPPQTSRVPVLLRVPAGPKLSIRPTVACDFRAACDSGQSPPSRLWFSVFVYRLNAQQSPSRSSSEYRPCIRVSVFLPVLLRVPAGPKLSIRPTVACCCRAACDSGFPRPSRLPFSVYVYRLNAEQSPGRSSSESRPRSSSESRPVLSRVLGRRSPGNHQVRLRLGPITSESPSVSIGRILHPVPDAPPQSTGLRGRLVRAPAPPLGRTKPSRAKLLLRVSPGPKQDFSADGRLGIFRAALSFSVNISLADHPPSPRRYSSEYRPKEEEARPIGKPSSLLPCICYVRGQRAQSVHHRVVESPSHALSPAPYTPYPSPLPLNCPNRGSSTQRPPPSSRESFTRTLPGTVHSVPEAEHRASPTGSTSPSRTLAGTALRTHSTVRTEARAHSVRHRVVESPSHALSPAPYTPSRRPPTESIVQAATYG